MFLKATQPEKETNTLKKERIAVQNAMKAVSGLWWNQRGRQLSLGVCRRVRGSGERFSEKVAHKACLEG